MEYARRDFLKTVGVAAALLPASRDAEAASAPATEKYVPAFRHFLSIGGSPHDELFDFLGGNYRGEVRTTYIGPTAVSKKSISAVSLEEVTVFVGTGLSRGIYEWIIAMVGRNFVVRDGDILSADAQGNIRSQMVFSDALITGLVFPPLDTHDRTPRFIALSFSPNLIYKAVPAPNTKATGSKPKALMAANFSLSISGLEASCKKVTRIESFSISQDFTMTPPPLKISDLVFYCPEEFADDFVAFANDFLGGNNLDVNEKTGTLEFLAPDKKTVYMTLNFFGLGIYGCTLEGGDMKAAANRLMKIEMYCETVSMTVSATSA